jgi:hypothetical protein
VTYLPTDHNLILPPLRNISRFSKLNYLAKMAYIMEENDTKDVLELLHKSTRPTAEIHAEILRKNVSRIQVSVLYWAVCPDIFTSLSHMNPIQPCLMD